MLVQKKSKKKNKSLYRSQPVMLGEESPNNAAQHTS